MIGSNGSMRWRIWRWPIDGDDDDLALLEHDNDAADYTRSPPNNAASPEPGHLTAGATIVVAGGAF